ncbi:hypothetical protein ANN_25049 [Periplaneta americana]|uniref:Uncharacterized protein n=1 Tax=Periplaneta americana TaxID=6978 RepID=A0ABQ8S0H8_PERAM|nr:hypothetical protein ANN_25049 [Periplaneta americana]
MAGLCEGGNEPSGSLKVIHTVELPLSRLAEKPGGPVKTQLKQSFRAKMPWSTGADVTRRFVYFYGRHLQWLGILGRSLLLGIPVATDDLTRIEKSKENWEENLKGLILTFVLRLRKTTEYLRQDELSHIRD